MDFLKIAIGNGVNISQLREWSSVPLDQIDNSSELAAIVIKNGDRTAKQEATDLRAQSDFPIPVIEVDGQARLILPKSTKLLKTMNKRWCQAF